MADRFDSDGRRFFVVVRRNEPWVRPIAAPTERERQVVAYAVLGRQNKLRLRRFGELERAATATPAPARPVTALVTAPGRSPS